MQLGNYRHGIHPAGSTGNSDQHKTYGDIYCWNNGNCGFADRGGDGSSDNIYDNLHCWDNGNHGIDLSFQNGGSLTNLVSYGNGERGMRIVGSYNFVVENCLVHSNGSTGIYIYTGDNIILSNVISKNNSTSNSNNDCGIHIYNVPSTKLSTCQFYDERDTLLQAYGIKLTGTNKKISLVNCVLTTNQYKEIYNPAGVVLTVITETEGVSPSTIVRE